MDSSLPGRLSATIRSVPDFPKPGIVFRDITTFLLRPQLLREAIEALWEPYHGRADLIAGIESRGFILAAAMAAAQGLPFVPMRKPGKLPAATWREAYSLEYGTDAIEVHQDALSAGQRVVIVDDLLATGGTAAAAARLVERGQAQVAGFAFLVELDFLRGRERLGSHPVHTLVHYTAE